MSTLEEFAHEQVLIEFAYHEEMRFGNENNPDFNPDEVSERFRRKMREALDCYLTGRQRNSVPPLDA